MKIQLWGTLVGIIFTGSLLQAQEQFGGKAMTTVMDKLMPVRDYAVSMVLEMGGRVMTIDQAQAGLKTRMEYMEEKLGMKVIAIRVQEEENGVGVGYLLMPELKMHLRTPIQKDFFTKIDDDKLNIKVEELGKESVGEQLYDKRRVTFIDDGKLRSILVWISPDLKNMPIKIMIDDSDGGGIITYTNYDFNPSDDLFTIPEGYRLGSDSDMRQIWEQKSKNR